MIIKETDLLLIDDNPSDRELFLKVLQKHSPIHKVEIAEDGNQALEMLLSDAVRIRPKLIILDLGLPLMYGTEVLGAFKSKDELKHIPVIVFSGSKDEDDLAKIQDLGADLYIAKPVNFDQFVESVHKISLFWSKL
jgi:two-component system response regulator